MIKEGTKLPINGRYAGVISTLDYKGDFYINVVFDDDKDENYIYKVEQIEDGFKLEKVIDEEMLTLIMLEFYKKIAKELGINE